MPDGSQEPVRIDAPRHVAIIMDGNGRWAARRGLPHIEGHRRGVEALREIVEAAADLGVKVVTLFAFSTENWRRPAGEVAGLMALLRRYLRKEAAELVEKRIKVRFIGDRGRMPRDIAAMMSALEAQTASGDRLTVVIAVNYGGRAEIALAARRLAERAVAGEIAAVDIDETVLGSCMHASDLPDPYLLIRTSGEQRISNFLLWQCAYAELVFAPELWPDFDRRAFERALGAFHQRERRFGARVG